VLLYINELAFQQQISRIPAALRQTFADGFDELAHNLGIKITGAETGVLCVDVTLCSLPNLFRFLTDANICAVTVEPSDAIALLGRTLDGLMLKRALESATIRLERVQPENLMELVRDAAWGLQQTPEDPNAPETQGILRDAARTDLLHAGIITAAECARDHDGFLEIAERATGKHDMPDRGFLPDELRDAAPNQYDPFL